MWWNLSKEIFATGMIFLGLMLLLVRFNSSPLLSLIRLLIHYSVLCPAHLVRQWLEEIEKYTRPHLNVIMWNNIRELKASTYQDIINAGIYIPLYFHAFPFFLLTPLPHLISNIDVVLFSHQMLYNDNYLNLKNTGGGSVNYKLGTTELSYKSRIEWVNAALTVCSSFPSLCPSKSNLSSYSLSGVRQGTQSNSACSSCLFSYCFSVLQMISSHYWSTFIGEGL